MQIKQRSRQSRENRQLGAVIAELAIFVPTILTVLILFWETMATILVAERVYSALIQLSVNVQPKPLKVEIVVDDAANNIKADIQELTDSEADDYLQILSESILTYMEESGSFATSTPVSVVMTLGYAQLDPDTGYIDATLDDKFIYKGNAFTVYSSSYGSECISVANQATYQSQLSALKTEKEGIFLAANKQIGTKLYEVDLGSGTDVKFVFSKPFVVGIICVDYSILGRDPKAFPFIFFPSKEVGLPNNDLGFS